MTYTCKICSATSDKVEFYKGVTSRCKECHKVKVRENRAANVEHYRQYDAKRFQEDPKVRERHRRYQSTEAGAASMRRARKKYEDNNREIIASSKREWADRNPEKRAAHILLGNAVRDGRLSKPQACQECGSGGRIHGHHEDYAKPLDVDWLCASCHAKRHKK